MNLVARGNRDVVRVYDRKKEPRFAEERDGWIKYDGTGLKGSVADFARENTSAEADGEKKIAYRQILSSGTEEEQSEALVSQLVADGVKSVAFAWGFEKKPTLQVYDADGESVDVFGSEHDGRTGKILGGAPPGLYGGGIAFPEYWTDEDGYTEPRVGFVGHYLKHLDRIIDDASNPHR